MNFPVPWRALLPVDAVPKVGATLREICNATNAGLEISGEGETPATLSDKICTITGSVEQKEAACRRVVDRLRDVQEVADQEPGVFVIIVPSTAAPVVVGQKGSQIKEVIELSGAEISVGKENILGMNDQPIGITGTGGQVVSAVSKINAILQDLAGRGRLQPADFKYRPGAVPSTGGLDLGAGTRGTMPSGGNPRTNAKFVVATQVAGWIIGKQGRHIRELQENSGSHIQVMKEGEVPPGVPPSDRIIEIGGRQEAKAEGIQIVLMAIDSMPALQTSRETQMLVPKALSQQAEVEELRQMSGADVEVRELPGHDEALCTIIGSIEARVKAAQHFLNRLEQVAQDGPSAASGMTSEARQALPLHREARSREDHPPDDAWSRPAPTAATVGSDRREESDPWSVSDPWSQGKPISRQQPQRETSQQEVPPRGTIPRDTPPERKAVSFGEREVVGTPSQPTTTPSRATYSDLGVGQQSFGAESSAHQRVALHADEGSVFDWSAPDARADVARSTSTSVPESGSFRPDPSPAADSSSPQTGFSGGSFSEKAVGSQTGGSTSRMTFTPDPEVNTNPAPEVGFSPSGPSGSATSSTSMATSFGSAAPGAVMSFGPDGSVGGMGVTGAGMGTMCGMGIGGVGMGAMGGLGGLGGLCGGLGGMCNSEAMFRAALHSSMGGQHVSQLFLLLPAELLSTALVPHGHLADIAQKCGIRIDLVADVPPDKCQVGFTGSVVANAMAAYFLQERSLQYAGIGSVGGQ